MWSSIPGSLAQIIARSHYQSIQMNLFRLPLEH
jgi:hypothetical protein